MMPYLYAGKIAVVDLGTSEVACLRTADYARDLVGGRGVHARIMYESIDADTDPLGPENVIALGTGPLSGTLFPGCSRTDVMAKSPVTNLLGNANIGGDWAAELKYAGFDSIVLKGAADRPVYVHIRNGTIELRSAEAFWGATTGAFHSRIKEELGDPEVKVLCIGPAGENLVTYASIHSNVGNAAARTGMGAVLGSKNVKALVVRGTGGIAVADPEAFAAACLEAHHTIRNADYYEEVSTVGVVNAEAAYVRSGIEAGGDAHEGTSDFDHPDRSDFYGFWKRHGHKRTGCMGCPVHCMENYSVPGLGGTVLSCELYTQLTAEVRNSDMRFWYELVKRCQDMGIDNTSMALAMQWLMELQDKGIIDAELTDGIPLEWGSREAIDYLMDGVIHRTGFGGVLADGMAAAAAYLDERVPITRRDGKSTYYWAMQVNNNPMYGINPRLNSMALSYAVGRRSDCIQDLDMHQFDIVSAPVYPGWSEEERAETVEHEHELARSLTGLPDAGEVGSYDGKAQIVHDMGITTGIPDMAGSCKWHTKWLYLDLTPEHFARALTAGLGRSVTARDLERASLRLRNLERALEVKMGRRRENDTIPEKEFNRAISRGYWKGKSSVDPEKFEALKDEYYQLRGWDLVTGVPYTETLVEFGLESVAADLADNGLAVSRDSGGDDVSGASTVPK